VIDQHIQALSGKNPVAREEARLALVEIGKPAVAALLDALRSPSQQVRWEACKALEGIADPSAAEPLVEALGDEDLDVRWVAGEAVIALDRHGLRPLASALISSVNVERLYEGAHHVARELAPHHPDLPLDNLIAALTSTEPELAVPVAANSVLDQLRGV
jgi:HEAT repeat protein